MNQSNCKHNNVECINPYELIRKYRCKSCNEIFMCDCDKDFGEKYLPHQLYEGCILETQERIPVTIGFQSKICNNCRNIPEEACPKTSIPGRTSKVKRYYWREIFFETMKRFDSQINEIGYSDLLIARMEKKALYKEIEKQVVEEIQNEHKIKPKYSYEEESQSSIIKKYNIEIINLQATYIKHEDRKVLMLYENQELTAEEFSAKYFTNLGYKVHFVESGPIHVLFGVFFWMLIEDPRDPNNRIIGFGDREQLENKENKRIINSVLPSDFGTSGYYSRRSIDIYDHIKLIQDQSYDLINLFDYWLPYSYKLRNYLWAINEEKIACARKLLTILKPDDIIKIFKYLIKDYWERFCGWPDLLVYNNEKYFFVEVKSSKDKLSEEQKNWIKGNHTELKFGFKITKIHKNL